MNFNLNARLKNSLENNTIKRSIPIVYFVCLSFITIGWFKNDFLFSVDSLFPIGKDFINEYFSIWADRTPFVGPDLFKLSVLFPYAYLIKLIFLYFPSISPSIIEKIIIYVLYLSGGLSVYTLSRKCFSKDVVLPHIIAGTFYVLNIYVAYLLSPIPLYLMFSYFVFPWVLFIFITLINSKYNIYKTFYLGILSYLLIATSYATPPYILIHFGFFISYFLFYFFNYPTERSNTIKVLITYFAGFYLLSLYWIYPIISTPKSEINQIVTSLEEGITSYKLNSARIVDALRLHGYFGFESDYKGVRFYSWYSFFESRWGIILSYIFVILSFFGLAFNNKNKKAYTNYLYFAYILMIFVFLLSFMFNPYSDSIKNILDPLNFFNVFRTAYQRFTGNVALLYSLMLGYSLVIFSEKVKLKYIYKFFLYLIILSLIYINGASIINGKIFDKNEFFASKSIKIPNEYTDLINKIPNEHNDTRILVLPFTKLGLYTLDWNNGKDGYEGAYPLIFMSKYRFISMDPLDGLISAIVQEYLSDSTLNANYFSSIFKADYFIFQKDLSSRAIYANSWIYGGDFVNLYSRLEDDKCLTKSLENEHFNLYTINAACKKSKAYTLDNSDLTILIEDENIRPETLALLSSKIAAFVKKKKNEALLINYLNTPLAVRAVEVTDIKSNFQDRTEYSLPNASYNPNSFIYNFIKLKEYIIRSDDKDVYKRLNDHLWFSSKRLVELSSFNLSDTKVAEINKLLDINLGNIFNDLNSNNVKKYDNSYYEIIDKLYFYLDLNRYPNIPDSTKAVVKPYTDKLDEILDYSPNCDLNRCFKIYIPTKGNYKMDIDTINKSNIKVIIDDKEIKSINDIDLDSGDHNIQLASPNIYKQVYFEEKYKSEVLKEPRTLIPSKYEIFKSIEIPDWDPRYEYELSFTYKSEGADLLVGIYDVSNDLSGVSTINDAIISKYDNSIKSAILEGNLLNHENQKIKMTLKPSIYSASKGVIKYMLRFDAKYSKTNIEIGDIKIIKKAPIQIHFLTQNIKNSYKSLNYERISPYMFSINTRSLRDKSVIVLSEKYHEGWDLYVKKDVKSDLKLTDLIKKLGARLIFSDYSLENYEKLPYEHIKIDDLYNGWIVKDNLNKDVVAYYTPQNTLYISAAGVAILFIILLIFIVGKIINKFDKYI